MSANLRFDQIRLPPECETLRQDVRAFHSRGGKHVGTGDVRLVSVPPPSGSRSAIYRATDRVRIETERLREQGVVTGIERDPKRRQALGPDAV